MECVDKKEGHEFNFIGYMVVCEEIDETPQKKLGHNIGTAGPAFLKLPEHFPAKIEVWQCLKCGHIKLSPAVFTRL